MSSEAWRFVHELARRVPLNHAIWRAAEAAVLTDVPMARPILDIGCGDGMFARMLFDEPIEVGVDLSISKLHEARGSAAYREVRYADATALPFEDGRFGTVFSNCVLEHIPDVDAVCREAARVLRPGGLFVFTVPSDRFGDFLFFPTVLSSIGAPGLARQYVRLMNRVFVHHHTDAAAIWTTRLDRAGLDAVRVVDIMPRPLTAFWDILMPFAAFHMIVRRLLPAWSYPVQRALLDLWREPIEHLIAPHGAPGANLVIVARKPR
jgi:SAM-dependent methyltransferase